MLAIGEKQTEEKKEKFEFIDILKSFACLCVVIGHVIRGLRKGPIEVSLFLKDVADFVYLHSCSLLFLRKWIFICAFTAEKGKRVFEVCMEKAGCFGSAVFCL